MLYSCNIYTQRCTYFPTATPINILTSLIKTYPYLNKTKSEWRCSWVDLSTLQVYALRIRIGSTNPP